ncbi:hypothetical protein QR680_014926 [Steinernema hermaphroditum]|uniref:RNA polymerase II-associated factor 1 homolog n=1 Tax=Steinernema hermaphroditum TaxID=289476 RepID=A0AA39IC01_9BILA|nr:hypothetical protein QR680_014926 [Steinernema hermaphroditum]
MSNAPPSSSHSVLRKKPKGTDFACRIKYSNTLPDVPFDTKFVPCPFVELSRFTKYKPTRLEREFKFELHTDTALDVKIDLINSEAYKLNDSHSVEMHKLDRELLEDDQQAQKNSKRSQQHNKVVPWMRKTEYIASEFNRFGSAADRQETKVGYSIKKRAENAVILNPYKDREQQIAAISKTFEDVKKGVRRHYEKPGVVAVDEMPLLPDFESWRIPFAQVLFDGDPLPPTTKGDIDKLQKNAIVRGMMDAGGEQFVAYFIPVAETLAKLELDDAVGRAYNPEETYEYAISREYNWTVKNKSTKGYEQENYFFVERNGKMYYNELETRVRLNRRRKDAQPSKQKSRLLATFVPEDEKEMAIMDERERMLINPYDEDEEEEERESEEEEEESG